MFGLTGFLNFIVIFLTLLAILALFLYLFWFSLPRMYSNNANARCDASFDPKRSIPLDGAASRSPQNESLKLILDTKNHTYSLNFGENRNFTDGYVKLHYNGINYTSKSMDHATKLEFLEETTEKFHDSLGEGQKTRWQWKIPRTDITFETIFWEYTECKQIIFETSFPEHLNHISTGDFNTTSCAFPALTNQTPNQRIFTFKNKNFAPPQRDFAFALAPVVMYDAHLNTILISSLNHYLTNGIAKLVQTSPKSSMTLECGFNGELSHIPANHSHKFIILVDHGINQTFNSWGHLLRTFHNVSMKDRYADVLTQKLGYWTDNGAYYYYLPLKNEKMDTTLIKVKDQADKLEIPFQYYQLDSWWYQKSVKKWRRVLLGWLGRLMGGASFGGTLLWEPDPEFLTMSLNDLYQKLGQKPFVTHNRWYSHKSPYVDKFNFIIEQDRSMPADAAFWDYLMQYCKDNHIAVYEQDWMSTHYQGFPQFRSEIGFGERWMRQMAEAAAKHGIAMQYCMATPAMMMQSLHFPNVSNIRASEDYSPLWLHRYDVPFLAQTSLLVNAVGAWPFKDTYHGTQIGKITGERCPELMALVSNLSAGPVGPGSPIDGFNVPILHAMCRKDGLLYKPQRPLTMVDVMFTDHTTYSIFSTESKHDNQLWHYILTANFWPKRIKRKAYTLHEIGILGDYVQYEWFTQEMTTLNSDMAATYQLKHEQFKFHILAPLHTSGYALLGDPTKFVMMNDKEFVDVKLGEKKLEFTLVNVENSESDILIYSQDQPKKLTIDNQMYDFTSASSVFELSMVQYEPSTHIFSFKVEFSNKLIKQIKVEF